MYYGYINMVEFLFFIFMRTRISLKYCPKIITIFNLILLMYINAYLYAAQF